MTDHRKGLAAAVRKGGTEAERAYKSQHADAEGLRMRADIAAFKPRPKAMRGHVT